MYISHIRSGEINKRERENNGTPTAAVLKPKKGPWLQQDGGTCGAFQGMKREEQYAKCLYMQV